MIEQVKTAPNGQPGLFDGVDDSQLQTRADAHPLDECRAIPGLTAGLGGHRHETRGIDALFRDPFTAEHQGFIGPLHGRIVEKASGTTGWSWPVFEEHWNYGFPQEMRHFARCVRGKETPISDGETGRVVQEVLYAAYASAGLGRRIDLRG